MEWTEQKSEQNGTNKTNEQTKKTSQVGENRATPAIGN
jgi:hypothetical protein